MVQDFCPLKVKITQFPDGFLLKGLLRLKFVFIKSSAGELNAIYFVVTTLK